VLQNILVTWKHEVSVLPRSSCPIEQ